MSSVAAGAGDRFFVFLCVCCAHEADLDESFERLVLKQLDYSLSISMRDS